MIIVLTAFPGEAIARRAAESLVRESLAACVNIIPGIKSIYQWEGKLEQSTEVMAFIKSTTAAWPALEARLRELHPYAVPEIIALPPQAVSEPYLQWVTASVKV